MAGLAAAHANAEAALKARFLAGFVPPDYIVDGLMQRGFVYSPTGATGSGKTAIALLIAQLMSSTAVGQSSGRTMSRRAPLSSSPVRTQTMSACGLKGTEALRSGNPQEDHLRFIDGVFDIKQMRAELQRLVGEVGGVNFVIVDTSAAYFLGQNENS